MILMSAKPRDVYWNDRETFRTDSEVRGALSTARDRLARSGRLKFRGRKLTKEATFAALCLWADAQDVRVLEDLLGPFVAQAERLVAEREKGGGSDGAGEGRFTFEEDGPRGGETKASAPAPGPAVPVRTERARRRTS